MDADRRLSRRKFVKRVAAGGAVLAGGGLAYSLLRGPRGPEYPAVAFGGLSPLPDFTGRRPNIVLVNADDLGFGDLSCYGSRAIRTPSIDALASEGMRFTDFHACDAVCTPSRAGLLTGRYPARMMLDTPLPALGEPLGKRAMVRLGYLAGRVGLLDLASRVASEGLNEAELTLPEALKLAGYRTGMVGKWHLGDFGRDARFNPVRHGFDSFFGVPYSNDMRPLPLFRGEEKLEADIPDQSVLTRRYTDEAITFIEGGGEAPFFLYLAHTFPHRPLAVSDAFRGSSDAGLYGDVVQELDGSVGRILEALAATGRAENTLVMLTSDNGPWYQGSAGAFRGRKGQAFEGGHRVPFIARAPGRIPAGTVCDAAAINLDVFPTCLAAAGLAPPEDRVIDGRDITALLRGETEASPHEYLFLYHQGELEGVRSGRWKYFRSTSHYVWPMPNNKKLGRFTNHTTGPTPLLYDLSVDSGEAYDISSRHPEVVERLETAMRAWEEAMAADPLGFREG
jgi:arylsulfatase A-like enzyme